VIVTNIVKYRDSTVLFFRTNYGGSISIPKTSYIQTDNDTNKLFVQSATDIVINNKPLTKKEKIALLEFKFAMGELPPKCIRRIAIANKGGRECLTIH
jgi:hypothetical protein